MKVVELLEKNFDILSKTDLVIGADDGRILYKGKRRCMPYSLLNENVKMFYGSEYDGQFF